MASSPTFSYLISGLNAGDAYMVRIRAKNSEGFGGFATTTPLSEVPREVPGVVTSADLLSLTNSTLKVVWNAPADGVDSGGATIDKYLIEWDFDNSFSNVGTSGYSHTFSDLSSGNGLGPFHYNIKLATSGLMYWVRIRAHNNMGYGTAAEAGPVIPVNRVPGEPHSVSLSIVSQAELLVSWTAPRTDHHQFGGDGGRPITKYLVEWDTDFSDPNTNAEHIFVDGSTLSYKIGDRNPLPVR